MLTDEQLQEYWNKHAATRPHDDPYPGSQEEEENFNFITSQRLFRSLKFGILLNEIEELREKLLHANQQNEDLKEVLHFYADPENYFAHNKSERIKRGHVYDDEYGNRAREALENK